MQLSEHRIFTATDFHYFSVQQHMSSLTEAHTTNSKCAKEAVSLQKTHECFFCLGVVMV